MELFWSALSRIWTEYGEIRSIFPYSVEMRENTDQNKSEYGYFLRSAYLWNTASANRALTPDNYESVMVALAHLRLCL